MIFTLSVTIVITSPRWPAKKTLRGEKTHTHILTSQKMFRGKNFFQPKSTLRRWKNHPTVRHDLDNEWGSPIVLRLEGKTHAQCTLTQKSSNKMRETKSPKTWTQWQPRTQPHPCNFFLPECALAVLPSACRASLCEQITQTPSVPPHVRQLASRHC